jgi:hypothetical protein
MRWGNLVSIFRNNYGAWKSDVNDLEPRQLRTARRAGYATSYRLTMNGETPTSAKPRSSQRDPAMKASALSLQAPEPENPSKIDEGVGREPIGYRWMTAVPSMSSCPSSREGSVKYMCSSSTLNIPGVNFLKVGRRSRGHLPTYSGLCSPPDTGSPSCNGIRVRQPAVASQIPLVIT